MEFEQPRSAMGLEEEKIRSLIILAAFGVLMSLAADQGLQLAACNGGLTNVKLLL
jgi:hypothetical protein